MLQPEQVQMSLLAAFCAGLCCPHGHESGVTLFCGCLVIPMYETNMNPYPKTTFGASAREFCCWIGA